MAESASRRELILETAAQLFASKGVASTTVREIADRVGLLSGSLYHHFESKDAIVDEVLRSFLEDLGGRYAEVLKRDLEPRAKFGALVHASMETVEAHPYATEIYQNDFKWLRDDPKFAHLAKMSGEIQKAWTDVLAAGRESGVFRADIEQQTLYRIIRDVVWLSVRWYRPGPGRTLSQLADDCTTLVLDGISTRRAPRRTGKTG